MLEAGLFVGQRLELVDGDLIDKMGQKPPHAFSVSCFTTWLAKLFDQQGQLRVQLPLEVNWFDRERSLPEPGICVIPSPLAELGTRHPRGSEAVLVIEVADSSVWFDLTVKRDLYARAGVREYWVLDIPKRELVIHRTLESGIYREVQRLGEAETAAPLCRPEAGVMVARLLPAHA